MRRIALAELGGRGSFTAHPSFSPGVAEPANRDRVAEAFQAGLSEGRRAAQEEAQTALAQAAGAQRTIELAFARFDEQSACELRERLRIAVTTICQTMAGEIALDPARLSARIETAAAMLRRKQDERVIRLNPADIAHVRGRIDPGLRLEPDATLQPGQLRVEVEDGGVEDGAEQWRAALAEALGTCLP